jgi:hypothetical protein
MLSPTTGPTVPVIGIGKNPAWYGPLQGTQWIGIAPTGDPSNPNFVTYPNGTIVGFTMTFTLPVNFVVSSAVLQVLADDTATGYVNGQTVYTAVPTLGTNCASGAPGCISSTLLTQNVTAYVHGGTNTFSTSVIQMGGSSFGTNYRLDVTGNMSCDPVPEPSTLAFTGLGALLCASAVIKRRAKK